MRPLRFAFALVLAVLPASTAAAGPAGLVTFVAVWAAEPIGAIR